MIYSLGDLGGLTSHPKQEQIFLWYFWHVSCCMHTFSPDFLKDFFFRAVLGLHQNWKGVTEISHIPSAPTHAWPLPSSAALSQKGTFLFNQGWTYKPMLTHHSQPKSIVYLRVHSWCYIFCGYWQMYDDIYLS